MKPIARHPLIRILSSLQVTVAALLVLALLVVWGTIYQAAHGLYDAQRLFFNSWGFLALGFVPVPGVVLVGAVLLVNLLTAMLFRLRWQVRQAGLILIHVGLLLFLGGGYLMLRVSQETYLTLREGESGSFSCAYHQWELAVWQQQGEVKTVSAVDADDFRTGDEIALEPFALRLRVRDYFRNSGWVGVGTSRRLSPRPEANDPAANAPGGSWEAVSGAENAPFTLFSGDAPRSITLGGGTWLAQLRLKRYPLPVAITLLDFRKTLYPGSDIPRSFESRVVVSAEGLRREALISMNKPLRVGEYTFYQSSYEESETGPAASTFSVVRNAGRLLPYYASAFLFAGLCLHFALMIVSTRSRRRSRP